MSPKNLPKNSKNVSKLSENTPQNSSKTNKTSKKLTKCSKNIVVPKAAPVCQLACSSNVASLNQLDVSPENPSLV